MMKRRIAMLAGFAIMLSACGGGGKPPPRSASRPVAPAPGFGSAGASGTGGAMVTRVMSPQGLGGVIGSPVTALAQRFGAPRIDLSEGDARKLQFAGSSCVLDIYLYPLSATAEPTATHVEARLRQGGAPVDPGACIREVERR